MEKAPVEFSLEYEFFEDFFMALLRHSLSLDKTDKVRVLQKLSDINAWQIIQLVDVYIEEQQKFSDMVLNDEHAKDVSMLIAQAEHDWSILDWVFELDNYRLFHPWILDALIHIWQRDITPHTQNKDNDELEEFLQSHYYKKWLSRIKKWAYLQENKEQSQGLDYFEKINFKTGRVSKKINQKELVNFCGEANKTALSAMMSLKNKQLAEEIQAKEDNEDQKLSDDSNDVKNQNFLHFLTPTIAIEQLGKRIFGQDDAVKKLVLAMYYHKKFQQQYILGNREFQRQMPMLLLGDTGWGKTHIAKTIAEYYDAKLTIVNCASMVSTGIVGMSVDNIGKMIIDAHKTIDESEFAIVFLDEFDKLFISEKSNIPKIDIISQLLSVIEGLTPLGIEYKHFQKEGTPTNIDTSKMLFILAGSFNIYQKNKAAAIGFHATSNEPSQGQLSLGDLGVPDELAGRIGTVVSLNPLQDSDYLNILYHSTTSPWTVFKNQLAMMHCTVDMDESIALKLIAQNKQSIQKFGARGLYQAFQKLKCIDDILLEATIGEHDHFEITLD